MISMTTYWKQYEDCLDHLPTSVTEKIQPLMETAIALVKTGKKIEEMGLTQIKGVSDQLYQISKDFHHSVTFDYQEKAYHFNLPVIDGPASLIFAALYYQHLNNYAQVKYDGVINWGRSFVDSNVEAKKHSTAIQAKAMFNQIDMYCQSKDIQLDNINLSRDDDESVRDYVHRLMDKLSIEGDQTKALEKLGEPDESVLLHQSLTSLESRANITVDKISDVMAKSTAFTRASKLYLEKEEQWQRQGLFTKLYYWLISWFYTSPLATELTEAKQFVMEADENLNKVLGQHQEVDACLLSLYQEVARISNERDRIQHEIKLLESMSVDKKESTAANQKSDNGLNMSGVSEQPKLPFAGHALSDYYSMFSAHMPSKQTVQAVAIGLAGIAMRNMTGGLSM